MNEIEEDVYDAVEELGQANYDEIARRTGYEKRDVQQAVRRLVESGELATTMDWEFVVRNDG